MVGNTPLVRLDKIAKREGLECELRTLNKFDTINWHTCACIILPLSIKCMYMCIDRCTPCYIYNDDTCNNRKTMSLFGLGHEVISSSVML